MTETEAKRQKIATVIVVVGLVVVAVLGAYRLGLFGKTKTEVSKVTISNEQFIEEEGKRGYSFDVANEGEKDITLEAIKITFYDESKNVIGEINVFEGEEFKVGEKKSIKFVDDIFEKIKSAEFEIK